MHTDIPCWLPTSCAAAAAGRKRNQEEKMHKKRQTKLFERHARRGPLIGDCCCCCTCPVKQWMPVDKCEMNADQRQPIKIMIAIFPTGAPSSRKFTRGTAVVSKQLFEWWLKWKLTRPLGQHKRQNLHGKLLLNEIHQRTREEMESKVEGEMWQ